MRVNDRQDPITIKLIEKYRGSNYLTRFMSEEQYQLTDSYINLVIVKQEDSNDKEKNCSGNQQEQDKNKEFRDERLATYESLHGTEKSIEIKNIFDKQDSKNNKEVKRILIYGRAGIGKSTLCQYLAVKWQDGSLWSDKFKAVIWLPLRELLDTEGKNSVKLEEVIKDKCIDGLNKPTKEEIKEYIRENHKNLLFILDGYDEIAQVIDSPKYMGLRRLLQDLLKDQDASVILTSRPMSIKLGVETIVSFDKQLENVGFTNENIKQYVQKFYPENNQKLIRFLEQNKSIWGIAHIPINLDLICSVWESSAANQETEYTMSNLYQQINKKLLERYLQKFQKIDLNTLSAEEYEEKTKNIIAGLEQLAIFGMENNHIIIPSSEVTKLPAWTEVLKSGLIKTTGDKKYEKDKDIYFLHLTFQEFYAASYIAKSLENIGSEEHKKAKALIAEHKYNPYYEVVWWFVAGILYERGEEKNNYLGLIHFWNEIESHPRELLGFKHTNLAIKCLDECMADIKIIINKEVMLRIVNCIESYVATKKIVNINSIIKSLSISPYAAKSKEISKALINKLQDHDWQVRASAAVVFGSINNNNPEVIEALTFALKDKDQFVRKDAAFALGEVGNIGYETVVSLSNLLEDESFYVRMSASAALGKNSKNNPKAVASLVLALKAEGSGVKRDIICGLGWVIESVSLEIIESLVLNLNDKSWRVKINVIETLAKVKNNDLTVSALLMTLKDEHPGVREEAAYALGNIGINDHRIISALLITLKDKDNNVRRGSAYALGNIVDQAIPEVVESLRQALWDNDDSVRKSAKCALRNIGNVAPAIIEDLSLDMHINKCVSPKEINNLIKDLSNEFSYYSYSRKKAAQKLGESGTNTPEIIFALLKALEDKESDVRNSADTALSKVLKIQLNNINQIAIIKDVKSIKELLKRGFPIEARLRCYAISSNIKWLDELLEAHNVLITLNEEKEFLIINTGQSVNINIRREQLDCLFSELIRQAKEIGLATQVYEHYQGTGKLGFNKILGIKELTPLHIAAHNGNLEKVKTILEKDKSDINDQNNKYKETPLMLATQNGHWEIVHYLTAQGADINCYNAPGDGDRKNVIGILSNIYDKHDAILGSYQNIKELLNQCYTAGLIANKGMLSKERLDAFMKAINTDSALETQKLLTINKADINDYIDSGKTTSLIYATQNRASSVVKKLMEFGADARQVNNKGESAITICEKEIDKLQNNLSKANILEALETLIKARSTATQFSRCLENAIINYPNENNLNQIVNDLVGCKNIEEYLKDERLRDIYRLHLGNIISIAREYGNAIRTAGSDSIILLSMRFYLYFKLLVKLHGDQTLITNDISNLGTQEIIERLKKECFVILETLHNERIRACCDVDEIASNKIFRDAHAHNVVTQLKTLKTDEEISLQSGYQIAATSEAHCLYVSFTKLENNKVLVRIDNRWVKSGRRDGNEHGKAPWVMRGTDNIEKIKPYCVGLISINDHRLHEYISNILYAISKTQVSAIRAIDYIYNIPQSTVGYVMNSIYNVVFEKPESAHVNKWLYQNRQTDSNANCTMSSHNFGVMVRNGEECFKWLCNWEKSQIWQDVTVVQSMVNENIAALRGATPDNSDNKSRTAIVAKQAAPKLYSHTELMKKFQQSLSVSWESVYTGIAVEQALVGGAGIKTSQNGSIFRAKGQGETAFSLKFASNAEFNKFIGYYNEKFLSVIKSKEVYNAKGLTTIVLDTQILYEKVTPFLQMQIALKNNYPVMANILVPISQVLRQRLSNPLPVWQGNNNYFSWLPQDVIIHILSFLPEASIFHVNTICSLLNKFTAQKVITTIERKALLESPEQTGFVEGLMQESNTVPYQGLQ